MPTRSAAGKHDPAEKTNVLSEASDAATSVPVKTVPTRSRSWWWWRRQRKPTTQAVSCAKRSTASINLDEINKQGELSSVTSDRRDISAAENSSRLRCNGVRLRTTLARGARVLLIEPVVPDGQEDAAIMSDSSLATIAGLGLRLQFAGFGLSLVLFVFRNSILAYNSNEFIVLSI